MAKTYDRYGGHNSLSRIGDFLLLGAIDFGDGIKELTITFYFPDSGPAKRTLEQLFEKYNNYRSGLPRIAYRRSSGKLEIEIASEIMDARDWKHSTRLSLPLFERGIEEVIGALPLIRNKVKASDGFDLEAFLAHCESARERIPGSEDAFQALAAELKAAELTKRDAMSPWEKLGIDWDEFHSRARTILDEPFFWECANDFSPNGNDTGADLLDSYRGWLKKHKNGEPIAFLEYLARQWGYADSQAMEEHVRDEAGIGLAFADIKLRGMCDEQARKLALECLQRQRVQAEAAHSWPHREDRLKSLKMIERKLRKHG